MVSDLMFFLGALFFWPISLPFRCTRLFFSVLASSSPPSWDCPFQKRMLDGKNVAGELRRRLEEERAARAAACAELEKERNAAAAAVDEAVAAIARLQRDRASMILEARAAQRYRALLEEKSARDEERLEFLRTQLRVLDHHHLKESHPSSYPHE